MDSGYFSRDDVLLFQNPCLWHLFISHSIMGLSLIYWLYDDTILDGSPARSYPHGAMKLALLAWGVLSVYLFIASIWGAN